MKPTFIISFIALIMSCFHSISQVDCTGEIPENYSGKCISHHANGEISMKGKYKKGKKNGKFESRFPNGKVQMRATFKDDHPVSEMLTYFPSGIISSRVVFKDNLGEMNSYHENGNLKSKGSLTEDGLVGIWYTYDLEGQLEDSTDFSLKEEREIIDLSGIDDKYDPYHGDEELRAKVDSIYEKKGASGVESQNELIEFPDIDAKFPGGTIGMRQFFSENVWYPIEATETGTQGVIYISFIVEMDGSISCVKVDRGVHELLDKESIRLILSMPRWIPAEHRGRIVRSQCRLPIRFQLD